MSYAAISSYIRPGFPKENSSDSAVGSSYQYRGPTATISANKPAIGDTWADGRPVVGCEYFEISAASAYADMMVVTSLSIGYSGTIGSPAVEQTYYSLRWRPVVKPLEVHPEFQNGGTYALDSTARKCILGWRAEQDPALRSQFKFKPLNSSMTPGTEVDIATTSANALAYLKLVTVGVEEWVDYLPIWRKRSIYKGSSIPPVGSIGTKVTPPGSPPSGYEWVKSADDAERIGMTSKWRRDEEYEGALVVYADNSDVWPPTLA